MKRKFQITRRIKNCNSSLHSIHPDTFTLIIMMMNTVIKLSKLTHYSDLALSSFDGFSFSIKLTLYMAHVLHLDLEADKH